MLNRTSLSEQLTLSRLLIRFIGNVFNSKGTNYTGQKLYYAIVLVIKMKIFKKESLKNDHMISIVSRHNMYTDNYDKNTTFI